MWIVVITIILSNLPAHNCSQLWFRLIFIWRPLKSGKTAFNLHAIGKGLFKNNAHFSNDSLFVEGCKKNFDTTKGLIIYAYFLSSPFLCYSWQYCDNNVIDQMWGGISYKLQSDKNMMLCFYISSFLHHSRNIPTLSPWSSKLQHNFSYFTFIKGSLQKNVVNDSE